MNLYLKKLYLLLIISVLKIGIVTESTCAEKISRILSTLVEADVQKNSEPDGEAAAVVTPIIQRKPTEKVILTSIPCTNCNNQDVKTTSLIESSLFPIIVTTTSTPNIERSIDCLHYSGSKFNIEPSKATLITSKVVPTTYSNPIPCCFLCNLMESQGCVMYTYAINSQYNAVCNIYGLPSNTNYHKYIIRVNSLNFVGFTNSFISLN